MVPPCISRITDYGERSCEATSCVDDVTCSRYNSVAAFGTAWHKSQNCKQVVSQDGSWVCYLRSVLIYTYEYLSSSRTVFTCVRMWGSAVIFRSQRVPRARTFWEHSFRALFFSVGSNLWSNLFVLTPWSYPQINSVDSHNDLWP